MSFCFFFFQKKEANKWVDEIGFFFKKNLAENNFGGKMVRFSKWVLKVRVLEVGFF